jgi:hypothetical protein
MAPNLLKPCPSSPLSDVSRSSSQSSILERGSGIRRHPNLRLGSRVLEDFEQQGRDVPQEQEGNMRGDRDPEEGNMNRDEDQGAVLVGGSG